MKRRIEDLLMNKTKRDLQLQFQKMPYKKTPMTLHTSVMQNSKRFNNKNRKGKRKEK